MFKTIMMFVSLISFSYTHEGHDHGPATVEAPNGGVIKTLEEVHIEVIAEKGSSTVKIYVYDTKMGKADLSKYPIKATATLPRGKAESLELKNKNDYLEYTFDAKKAHRYTLDLSIKQHGHDDKLSFTIEPK
jgi:hypothetical protein